MKPCKQHVIRCYVLKRGDCCFAGCTTLNLTASGKTVDEAKKSLEDSITLYFETVFDGKKSAKYNDIKHLLKRPAPLYMYIDLIKCFMQQNLYKLIHRISNGFTFEEQIPDELCVSNI